MSDPGAINGPSATDSNDRWTVFSVVAGSAVALLVLLTGPIIVGAYVTTLGLSERLAGLMFSLEMLGFTFGALAMFAALSAKRRHVVTVALAIMVGGNVLSMLTEVTVLLAACRFFTGIGAGILMTMTVLVIGLMRNPDSVYGLWTIGQLALGATGLIAFPPIIETLGLPAVFAILAILSALLFSTTRFYSLFPHPLASRPHKTVLEQGYGWAGSASQAFSSTTRARPGCGYTWNALAFPGNCSQR